MQALGENDGTLMDKNGRKVLGNKTYNTTETTANLCPKHTEGSLCLSDVDSVISSDANSAVGKDIYFNVSTSMLTSTPIYQSRVTSYNFSCPPNDVITTDPKTKFAVQLISDSGYSSKNDEFFKTPASRDGSSKKASLSNFTRCLPYSTPDYRDRSIVRTSSTNCTSQELDISLDIHDKNEFNFFPCLQSTPSDVFGVTEFSQKFNCDDEFSLITNWQKQISSVNEENLSEKLDSSTTSHSCLEFKEPTSHSSSATSQSFIKSSYLPQLDSFHERINYVSNSFSPEAVNSLIGKKMGLDQFDIIEGLLLKGHKHLTSCILGHLPDEDLTSFLKVSKSWKAVVDGDLMVRRRWRSYISNMKLQHSLSKENTVKSSRLHQSLPIYYTRCSDDSRHVLQSIQPTATAPRTKKNSDVYDLFLSAARKLRSHERLTKCPLCSGPASISDLNATCVSDRCSYQFCSKCQKPRHGVSLCEESFKDVVARRPAENISICSQGSKRRLRRL